MTQPIVAIVGRTNVGKSTLLNRLVGHRLSIIADMPRTTRDRIDTSVSWQGNELTLVDTGGWQIRPPTPLDKMAKQQTEVAIAQADVILFMVDVKDGLIPADEDLAEMLRVANKPIVLVANKIDSSSHINITDFYRLGFGSPMPISAYHNRGIMQLMDTVLSYIPHSHTTPIKMEETKLAIVGRPNVGKSTLLNKLLGEERAITDASPGTTRDSIHTVIHWDDKKALLIDTGGIRRRGRTSPGIDYYGLLRTLQAIDQCDVALLLVDATQFITAQDMHIAGYIIDMGKGMVLIVNKWDLVPQEDRQEFKQQLSHRLNFMSYIPTLYLSAKSGSGINYILPKAWQIWEKRQHHLSQSTVEELIHKAISVYPPPRRGTRQLHVAEAYQDRYQPTTFIIRVNDPRLVHFSYQRYLTNQLRQGVDLYGNPLRIIFTKAAHKNSKRKKVVYA
ncbi:MAG: ribosome biogenesis GTPase Der [Dehalococcoidia bacterium]|nr:ribosome biogenesis GTPase Der [Dehalococcoidia bacterium]